MTEEEARKKWCPHVRFAMHEGDGAGAANRADVGFKDWNTCLGSDCMAWRKMLVGPFYWMVELDGKPEVRWAWDPTEAESYKGRVKVSGPHSPADEGFCGLAGAPQ